MSDGHAREAELRRRLAEAEDTLRAIREGEVDALVVRGAEHDEIFALGMQDSYRSFMEAMDLGAAALDADGALIYANSALCALLGRSSRDLQRDGLFEAVGARASQIIRQLLVDSGQNRRNRPMILPRAGGYCHVEVSVAPLSLGFGYGHALTFTDVTERIEAAAANESDRIGQAIMASSNEAVVVCDRTGKITQANAAVRQFSEGRVAGRQFEEVFPFEFSLESGLVAGSDLVDVALAGTAVRGAQATLMRDGGKREFVLSASPLRQASEAIFGCVVSIADITDSRLIEKQQALLMNELNHRVKNTLTLVMSIANRTARAASNLDEFRAVYGRRIEALALTHDLLAQSSWAALTIEELIATELAPYVSVESARVHMAGLDLKIGANAAVALGLILHELVTNAVKYGSLSVETGRIAIEGCLDGDVLTISWEESGGPTVLPQSKTGFGQTLIRRGLGNAGGRPTEVEFRPEGLVCRMHIPIGSASR